jgi:hypothetical protein
LEHLIEGQAHNKDANTEFLVREYKEFYNDRPILRLVQDIGKRSKLYNNLLEEIKRIPPDVEDPNTVATGIKEKYENFGFIKAGYLPNPTVQTITRYIMDKLASFARLILDLLAKYASKIAEELQVSPEVTITFQVGASGWSPDVTIGIERAGSWGRAVG